MSVEPALLELAAPYASRSYVPYSGRNEAVIVLVKSGLAVPGVRVENASFSLTISALQNAISTARVLDPDPPVAVQFTHPPAQSDIAYLSGMRGVQWSRQTDRLYSSVAPDSLQVPIAPAVLTIPIPRSLLPDSGVAMAREAASRAYIPESGFAVGCLLESGQSQAISAANVEHSDWNQILCAERNALSTAITAGLTGLRNLYISASSDSEISPCGACRQVILELAPGATVWMDRGNNPALGETGAQLLPHSFAGRALQNPKPPTEP